jgi:DNA repair exonuclease SbcCD ATPase subunit
MCTADAESLARELAEARERAEAGAAALASAVERERSALEDLALCREQASRHSVEAESLARQLTEARECAETQAATAAAAARQERSALEELELFREQASRHFNEAQNLARQLTEAQGGAEMEAAVALQQLARCREQIRSLEAQVAALTNAVAPCAADREAALGARERNEEAQVEVFDKQSEAGAGAANLEGVVAFETEEVYSTTSVPQHLQLLITRLTNFGLFEPVFVGSVRPRNVVKVFE